jgi:hypothetical protein
MHLYNRFILQAMSILAGISLTGKALAQNNTSPYSMIGIGDLEKSSFDRTSGMGHAGVALSSNRYMYQANPAAMAWLDEHFFQVELSGRFKDVNYYGTPITDISQNRSNDLQIKKIALAIKLRPKWTASAGLMPFSTSNYSFYGEKTIQGSNLYANAYYEGSGSTNLFYLTNSFSIGKHFSIGLQSSYLFGQLLERETLAMDASDSVLTTNRNIFIGKPYFRLGVQYKTSINKNLGLSMGAVASNKTQLHSDYGLTVIDGSTTIINNEYYKSGYFTLPAMYTAGLAATLYNKYTFAVDYHYEGWSSLHMKGLSYSLEDSRRFSAGFEYSKKIFYQQQVYEPYFLQAGIFHNTGYLKMYGQQLKDYGLTLGGGLQLARSGLGIQGALEVGSRGTTVNGLIKENYTQFSFTISYRDFWYTRAKKYD